MAANDHSHRPVLGVFLKLSSVALLSCLAACVKYLGDAVPTGQIIFVRGLISMAVLHHFEATADERTAYIKMSRAVRGEGESEETVV